jgi:hypothetical protein
VTCVVCRTGREPLCPNRKFTGDWGLVGGYAEYVAIEDDNVALVPDGVALQDASIVACAVGTILNAIREVGRLAAGESVLVTGAGGGLGMHAVQLARLARNYFSRFRHLCPVLNECRGGYGSRQPCWTRQAPVERLTRPGLFMCRIWRQ